MTIALALTAGFILLVLGGELLVRGAVRVAEQAGLSPLLIGITLVGFGTSAPEIVTSVQAALIGSPGIAVGNIVGSNMANMLLILGASALICPLFVESRALKRDGMVVVATAALLLAVGWTVGLSRGIGAAFLVLLVAYLVFAFITERDAGKHHGAAYGRAEAMSGADIALRPRAPVRVGARAWLAPLGIAVGGLVLVIIGGRLLVSGAIDLARVLGMSEEVIGLTVVAAGTSMPELVTCMIAAFRHQADVAVGNILGSNIYNVLGIGGLTGTIAPTAVPAQIANLDAPLMFWASLLLFLFAWTGLRLNRVEGAFLLGLYVTYIAWLVYS